MRNQAQVFLGLFLIAFGLYAAQLKKKPTASSATASKTIVADLSTEPRVESRVQVLYDRVAGEKVFSHHIAGVFLQPTRALVKNDFTVSFSGDEIFNPNGFSIHPSWESTLDSLAELIKNEPGLQVEISGFADENNPAEKNPSDYGSSALSFSFARAEWLAHYFERKHGINISKSLVLRGMGAVPQGKKIELRFYYHSI